MGNSLQDYRCRIGTFSNNRLGVKNDFVMKNNVARKTKSFKFNLMLLLTFSSVFILISSNGLSSLHKTSHSIQLKQFPKCPEVWLPSSVRIVNTNFESRYKYGNKNKNGIKIMHWNAGGKHLVNKIENIESVINGYKPSILGISEANYLKRHDINDVQIENYKLFLSNNIHDENIEASRVVVHVHNDIACKISHDWKFNCQDKRNVKHIGIDSTLIKEIKNQNL